MHSFSRKFAHWAALARRCRVFRGETTENDEALSNIDDAHKDEVFCEIGGVQMDSAIGYRTGSVLSVACAVTPSIGVVLQLINNDASRGSASGGGDGDDASAPPTASSRVIHDESDSSRVIHAQITLPQQSKRGFLPRSPASRAAREVTSCLSNQRKNENNTMMGASCATGPLSTASKVDISYFQKPCR